MPVQYHASFESKKKRVGNMAFLTFKTKVPGPIKALDPSECKQYS